MSKGISHKKGYEQGHWYEIKCVGEIIANKEAKGESANFERRLLKSWSKYPGWEDAKGMPSPASGKSTRTPLKVKSNSVGCPSPQFGL